MNPIKIWPYNEAPKDFQFYRGGDEDFVVFIPTGVEVPYWLEREIDFNNIPEETHPDHNGTFYVMCHA